MKYILIFVALLLACVQTTPRPALLSTSAPHFTPSPLPSLGDISSCASDPLRSTGTVYYICDCQIGADAACIAGSDSNTGTSSSAPKQTLSAAVTLFQNMNAGDTVAFCKGGRWPPGDPGGNAWQNTNCTTSSTCDLRSYNPPWGGSGARPYFVESGTGDIGFFRFVNGTTPNGGYRFQGLEIHGINNNGLAAFFYNATENVLFCDMVWQDLGEGIQVQPTLGTSQTRRHNIHLVSSDVSYNSAQGWLGGCTGCQILNNTFRGNGSGVRDHNIYVGAQSGTDAPGMTIKGNYATGSGAFGGSQCTAVEIVAHGTLSNLTIDGNTIEEAQGSAGLGCWGIQVSRDADNGNSTAFASLTVKNNIVRYVGNLSIDVDNAHDFIIENNLVIGEPGLEQKGISACNATKCPNGAGSGDACQQSFLCRNGRIRNNTIYISGSSSWAFGINLGNQIESTDLGGEVYNNVEYVTGKGTTCTLLLKSSYHSYNACATTATSTWFTKAPIDMTPAIGGPLIKTGTARGGAAPTTDITGKIRSSPPSVGAYEPQAVSKVKMRHDSKGPRKSGKSSHHPQNCVKNL